MSNCVFCDIVIGESPAIMLREYFTSIVITPLNPVTPGHVLVIPKIHAKDFSSSPVVSANTMSDASRYVKENIDQDYNLITSKGSSATQTVHHLHLHLVPRRFHDGLSLPWTGQDKDLK